MTANTRVLLARRPRGAVTTEDFEIVREPRPEPGPRDVLVRNIYLSCDPYLRGRMDSVFAVGEVVPVRVVGQVLASNHGDFAVGDFVWGFLGWEEYTLVLGGTGLTRVDPSLGPISHFVSVLGMPGLTAWVGMIDIGRPQPGETVLVSSAAGAVGSLAGQLARLAGARVVGSVGSPAKVDHVVDNLGFDAAFDRHAGSLDDLVATHCPDGVDVYFDNVGGPLLEAALRHLNDHARIPVCGMISRYQSDTDPGVASMINVLVKRATITGFSIYDHTHRLAWFVPHMADLLARDLVHYVDDIHVGIEHVPDAFVGMLAGDNIGKRLVRVGDDPTS